jgi:hypothetical protein
MRDLLALLYDARAEDRWLDVHFLVQRTGVPYAVMQARLSGLVDLGFAGWRRVGGRLEYQGTELARDALGPR